MKYKSSRSIVRFMMNSIADVEIVGMEKIPQGNVILAANHLGRLDTAVLLYALDREDIIMAIAEKYKNHPLFGVIGRAVDGIWLNRFEADFAALREILVRMKRGGFLFISPGGTRPKNEALQQGQKGGAFLRRKNGTPVVAVSVDSTSECRINPNL